jgi:hypothetical protein
MAGGDGLKRDCGLRPTRRTYALPPEYAAFLQVQVSLRTRVIIGKKRQYHDIASTCVSERYRPKR